MENKLKPRRWISMTPTKYDMSRESNTSREIMKDNGLKILVRCLNEKDNHGIIYSSKEFTPANRGVADIAADTHALLYGCPVESADTGALSTGNA